MLRHRTPLEHAAQGPMIAARLRHLVGRKATVSSHIQLPRVVGIALLALGSAASALAASEPNDYPTDARADYVFGCMKVNGDTRQVLEQCSCSIDVIASILPYERYVTAESVLSLAQVPSVFGAMFRSEQAKSAANDLRRAQAEAEVRCF
jgi:hypothetical protein